MIWDGLLSNCHRVERRYQIVRRIVSTKHLSLFFDHVAQVLSPEFQSWSWRCPRAGTGHSSMVLSFIQTALGVRQRFRNAHPPTRSRELTSDHVRGQQLATLSSAPGVGGHDNKPEIAASREPDPAASRSPPGSRIWTSFRCTFGLSARRSSGSTRSASVSPPCSKPDMTNAPRPREWFLADNPSLGVGRRFPAALLHQGQQILFNPRRRQLLNSHAAEHFDRIRCPAAIGLPE